MGSLHPPGNAIFVPHLRRFGDDIFLLLLYNVTIMEFVYPRTKKEVPQ